MKWSHIALVALLASVSLASAQQTFRDGDANAISGQDIGAVVVKRLNPSGKAVALADPCFGSAKTTVAFSGATGQFKIVTGVAAKKAYICLLDYGSSGAVSVSVIEGTGTNCGTGAAAMIGSTTAAAGVAEAANAVRVVGNGSGTVTQTATAADDICILQTGTATIAGVVSIVQE